MKVRILSGNQAGLVVEQRKDEAEMNISTGFAEAVIETPVQPAPATRDEAKPAPVAPAVSPKAAAAKPRGPRR